MLKNYLTIALRKLKRYKLYYALNGAGLVLSITCCLILFLVVRYELSFDKFHTNANQIYRITTDLVKSGEVSYDAGAPYPIAQAVRSELPQAGLITTTTFLDEALFKVGDKLYKEKQVAYVEP